MHTFAVYDMPDRPALAAAVDGAWMFGAEDLPVAARVWAETGRILADRPGPESAGLCLLVNLDPTPTPEGRLASPGRLFLKTCLLPPRERPYLLSLELARHALMLLLNKLEEWDLFELPEREPVMRQVAQAQRDFTDALIAHRAQDREPHADLAARRALALVLDAAEQLTLIHADRLAADRLSGRAHAAAVSLYARHAGEPPPPSAPVVPAQGAGVSLPYPPLIGCTVPLARQDAEAQQALASVADFVSVPLPWAHMEPTEGKLVWTATDKWIEWAVRSAKLPVVAGPIIDLRPGAMPEWLAIWENDYDTLRDLVVEHIQAVVTRYRRAVARWTVVSGLNTGTALRLSAEHALDLTRIAVMAAKRLHPAAQLQVEITHPWGQYHANNRKTLPPLAYAELLVQSGLPIDAMGLRLQMGHAGHGVRDLMSLAALIDRFSAFDRPLAITTLGAPAAPAPPAPAQPADEADAEAGYWRAPWSPATQAHWLNAVGALILARPCVHSLCWQRLADEPDPASQPSGGLLPASGPARPALAALAALRKAVRDKRAPADLLNQLNQFPTKS